MTKILMVCLGNICRSPLAEGIMQSKLSNDSFKVDSAGTAGYHIGNAPDPRSIDVARKNGLDISNQKCRKFDVEDFDTFDRIFVMDRSNFENVVKLARNPEDISKVSLIMDLLHPNENIEVPDPYYGGDSGFDNVYNMLDNACDRFIEKLS
jgi:protein-tyrosine phosphatase